MVVRGLKAAGPDVSASLQTAQGKEGRQTSRRLKLCRYHAAKCRGSALKKHRGHMARVCGDGRGHGRGNRLRQVSNTLEHAPKSRASVCPPVLCFCHCYCCRLAAAAAAAVAAPGADALSSAVTVTAAATTHPLLRLLLPAPPPPKQPTPHSTYTHLAHSFIDPQPSPHPHPLATCPLHLPPSSLPPTPHTHHSDNYPPCALLDEVLESLVVKVLTAPLITSLTTRQHEAPQQQHTMQAA